MADGFDGKTLFFEFLRTLNKANNFSRSGAEVRERFETYANDSGNKETLMQIFDWYEKTRPKNRMKIREYCDSLVADIDSGIV